MGTGGLNSISGAGDLVAVWGPGGHRDTANRPEKGGPAVHRDAPLGRDPFGFATYQDVTSSPAPLCPHWVLEWGTTGERVGVSPAGFCLPFFPHWLGTNIHMPPARRLRTMDLYSRFNRYTHTIDNDNTLWT